MIYRNVLFSRIRYNKPTFPNSLSSKCVDFISKLMIKDKYSRLGASKYDSEEIKNHPYFSNVNWKDVALK